jgi:hypothetical protein
MASPCFMAWRLYHVTWDRGRPAARPRRS